MADLNEAKGFLIDNFLCVLRRTRRLYVELARQDQQLKSEGREHGYFEPVLLCICWCDFLGALYLGEGKGDDKRRIVQWLKGPMASRNKLYRKHASKIHEAYRNGLVHGFQPNWFDISYDEPKDHLVVNGKIIKIDVSTLIDDMIASVGDFASQLSDKSGGMSTRHGSLEAFNHAAKELKIKI